MSKSTADQHPRGALRA
jgi:hypothetical protein